MNAGAAAAGVSDGADPTIVTGPGTPEADPLRDEDLRIAAILLRGGQPAPARAALEAAHAQAPLTATALLDLAEARWRTGALVSAGHAAEAYLASGGAAALATIIAAEAAMADGRPADARAWVARSAAIATESIEAVFAGIGRSELWPPDSLVVAPTREAARASRGSRSIAPPGPSAPAGRPPAAVPADSSVASPVGDLTDPDARAELSRVRAMLRSGAVDAGALRLAVLLRTTPEAARLVIEALEGEPGPVAALVRGDAHRLLGNQDQAGVAYAAALASTSPVPPSGAPAARPQGPGSSGEHAPDGQGAGPSHRTSSSSSQEENP